MGCCEALACAGCLLADLEAADQRLVGLVGTIDLHGPYVDEVGAAAFNVDGPRGVVLAVLLDTQVVGILAEAPVVRSRHESVDGGVLIN